jgi:hypothetical protein
MEYRQGSVIFYFESLSQTYAKFCVAQSEFQAVLKLQTI